MTKENIIATIISIIAFTILITSYEYYTALSIEEQGMGGSVGGAVIRVDIFIIYPIILIVSILFFLITKRLLKKEKIRKSLSSIWRKLNKV